MQEGELPMVTQIRIGGAGSACGSRMTRVSSNVRDYAMIPLRTAYKMSSGKLFNLSFSMMLERCVSTV